MKSCRACGARKPINEFHRNGKQYRHSHCKDCRNASRRTGRRHVGRTREDQVRHQALVRRYGVTAEEYDAQLKRQGGGCAACGAPPAGRKRLHVDHDHSTGQVRGICCARCNTALAVLEDALLVDRLTAYLAAPPWAMVAELGSVTER